MTVTTELFAGCFLSAEAVSNPQGGGVGGKAPAEKFVASVAEELGEQAAYLLLEEIYRGGVVDSSNQHLVLLFMALGQKDVSKVMLGPLSPYT